MTPRRRFRIFYAPVVKEHLRIVERKYYRLIREEIELHLSHAPDQESTNRKRLAPTTEVEAEWQLRGGPKKRWPPRASALVGSCPPQVATSGHPFVRRLRIGGE